ncbi:cytochrome P450 [Thiocapsa marina]|uniref:Unspecific monooxygenase n=1 Tax=Thiocapsa marina 5811 TaxID=768671 RepID=F9UAF9_9GAMM|nr:cytochrome P450 [Thiocapsa marina]EGV19107.1 Unspecific monooxygenase [Thiocapsa marina 5811]
MSSATYTLVERRGHWLTGCLQAFREDRLGFLAESARIAPIVGFRLGPRRVYLLSHPDLIRDMLVAKHRHLTRDPLVRRILEKTLGVGLLTSEGEAWKRHRRMIAPALHLQQVRGYADSMVRHALALTERWHDGQEADVEQEMDGVTLSIITEALFRVDSTAHTETVAATVPALQTIATTQFDRLLPIPDWLPTPEHRRQRALSETLGRIVSEAIHRRRASGADGDDLLTLMVHMTDADTGARLSDEEIRAEVLTLYLAGYDTTALTLTYVWYHRARQPEIAARFHAEIDAVLGGRLPGFDDLERLPYTRMVFKEALRLYPAAYLLMRAAAEPLEIGGHRIAANSVLMTSPYAMHRHPELWEDPERFDPERFADNAELGWHTFKYFPFGGGPHICIGNQFASVEGPLILATIGQHYRFELLHPNQQLELEPQITLGPKGGMPLRLHRRRPSREAD